MSIGVLAEPFVDYVAHVSANHPALKEGRIGDSIHIEDEARFNTILETLQGAKRFPGGSASNTAVALSFWHKDKVSIYGIRGRDDNGKFLKKFYDEKGINFPLPPTKEPTNQAICLATTDRTILTHIRASKHFCMANITDEMFNHKIMHFEGYMLWGKAAEVEHIMAIAKKKGIIVSLDLACVSLIKVKKELILRLLKDYVDIVFANQEEGAELFPDPKEDNFERCGNLRRLCAIASISMGKNGCYIASQCDPLRVHHFPTYTEVAAIEFTGAGDNYNAGFLHYLCEYLCECLKEHPTMSKEEVLGNVPLNRLAYSGHIMGATCVSMDGAYIPVDTMKEVDEVMKIIKKMPPPSPDIFASGRESVPPPQSPDVLRRLSSLAHSAGSSPALLVG